MIYCRKIFSFELVSFF